MHDGPRVAPSWFVHWFHVQLKDWFEETWSAAHQSSHNEAPSFEEGFCLFKRSRNLRWLPPINHLPLISRLRQLAPGRAEDSKESDDKEPMRERWRTGGRGGAGGAQPTGRVQKDNHHRDTHLMGMELGEQVCAGSSKPQVKRPGKKKSPLAPDGTKRCLS